jgi:hypothetical protein
MTTLAPFAVVPGAEVFDCTASPGGGVVVGYRIVSIFGSAVIRFFDASGVLLDQTEVVTPSGFASCDRIFVGNDGFVAVWRGNEIRGGIVLARRGDAVARVWRPTTYLELDGVAPAPALGGVFAWAPRDIFLVRADGSSERVAFALANDRRVMAVCAWGHDLVVVHERAVDTRDAATRERRFSCIRGDGTPFLEGAGRLAMPASASSDIIIVWGDGAVLALDRSGIEVGRLSSSADDRTWDLLGRSRSPFLVLDDGDVVFTNSDDSSVVRWDPRTGTTRWKTRPLAEPPYPLAQVVRVGRFIAVAPAKHAPNGSPLWMLDATTGRVEHQLPLTETPYAFCAVGDDAVATSFFGNFSPAWRGLSRETPEALTIPHARECLTPCSPAPGVVVTGDVMQLAFFRL